MARSTASFRLTSSTSMRSIGEAINFREFEKTCDVDPATGLCDINHVPQPLSRFFGSLDLNLGKFTSSSVYYYYPYIPGERNVLTTSMNYALSRGVHQGLYTFDRSISLTYAYDQHATSNTDFLALTGAYSLSDYFLPTAYISYNFVSHSFINGGVQMQFQSPARCWKLTFNASYDSGIYQQGNTSIFNGFNFNFDLALNISGTGFGGVTEAANTATAPK